MKPCPPYGINEQRGARGSDDGEQGNILPLCYMTRNGSAAFHGGELAVASRSISLRMTLQTPPWKAARLILPVRRRHFKNRSVAMCHSMRSRQARQKNANLRSAHSRPDE
jgi:hypothetical protein